MKRDEKEDKKIVKEKYSAKSDVKHKYYSLRGRSDELIDIFKDKDEIELQQEIIQYLKS